MRGSSAGAIVGASIRRSVREVRGFPHMRNGAMNVVSMRRELLARIRSGDFFDPRLLAALWREKRRYLPLLSRIAKRARDRTRRVTAALLLVKLLAREGATALGAALQGADADTWTCALARLYTFAAFDFSRVPGSSEPGTRIALRVAMAKPALRSRSFAVALRKLAAQPQTHLGRPALNVAGAYRVPSILKLCATLQSHEDEGVRTRAAHWLLRAGKGDGRAVEIVAGALLKRSRDARFPVDGFLVDALAVAARSANRALSGRARQAMSRIVLSLRRGDNSWDNLALRMMDILAELRGRKALPLLEQVLRSNCSAWVRGNALRHMVRLDPA